MFDNTTAGSGANASTVGYSLTDFSDGPQPHSQPWDTSDPFFSAGTRDLLQRVLKCYIRQTIVFVGISGNVLCCTVFLKQGLSDRITLLLFWLAVADLTNLMSHLFLMPGCYLVDPIQAANWSIIVNAKVTPITTSLVIISGTVTLLLSVDRCLSIVVPFKVKWLLKYRFTAVAIFVSYMLPLTFAFMRFMAFTVRWRTDPSTNHSVAYMAHTSWFPMDSRLAYNLLFYFSLVTKPAFLVVMIVCCTITIVHLRRASSARMEMGGNVKDEAKSGENRITVMLMVICGAYVVYSIPEMFFSFTIVFVPEYFVYRTYHNSVIVHAQFIWIASCLNSAINFFPYLLLSSKFQKSLQELCGCFAKQKHLSVNG